MEKRTIKVVCFAGLRKYFGGETVVSVPADASFKNIIEKLGVLNPEALEVLEACRIAVDEKFVPLDEKLNSVETVFLIPPSSGG